MRLLFLFLIWIFAGRQQPGKSICRGRRNGNCGADLCGVREVSLRLALILTFSPAEKEQPPDDAGDASVRPANPALGFSGGEVEVFFAGGHLFGGGAFCAKDV
jgi:hypothetical protein